MNRNQELQNNKQGAAPRVVVPPTPVTRSSVMIDQKTLPIQDVVNPTVVSYNDLSNVPTEFVPAAHTQDWSTITDQPTLSELVDDDMHRTVTDSEKSDWNMKPDNEFVIVMSIVLG